ncbi:hypothetical protein OEZ60_15080 [Defluviimonas sp. WL0024]|uniref:Uncharacterized protein n=1 Tax=Albidovulum salinarum TaxID=2984153 RepID=A0ABT2XCA6_9RHOB|nr:hypothetical protein [Defluviimonas sp. WL0024]MCU9849325.1 hypothetical protein [Defluviimonas sp. WL0024]
MAFDPKSNTISVGEGEDFFADSGQFFILTLKKLSEDPSLEAGHRLKNDWRVIEEWLGCRDRELNHGDMDRIARAWKAYLAIGLAPSEKLQASFDHQSRVYKMEGYSPEKDKAPAAVMDVFDRLLATDGEIAAKQKRTIKEEARKYSSLLHDFDLERGTRDSSASHNGGLKGMKVDKEKLPKAIAAIWLLLSIPLSIPIYEEFFRGDDILSRVFSWLIVGSASWLPFGWRWLTNNQAYPRAFVALVALCGIGLIFLFLDDRYLDEYFYIPLAWTMTFVAIAVSHDGMRILRRSR